MSEKFMFQNMLASWCVRAWAVFEPGLQDLSAVLKADVELHVRPGDRELQCLPAPANSFGIPKIRTTLESPSSLCFFACMHQ